MKKYFLYLIIFLIAVIASGNYNPRTSNQITLQFISYNGFGNNLYIDNLLIGQGPDTLLKITGITNIPRDTFYSPNLNTVTLIPLAKITNFGKSNFSMIPVTMTIDNLAYSSTIIDTSLNSGETKLLTFDSLVLPAGIPLGIVVSYTYPLDSVKILSDSMSQYSVMLNGASRKVLLEEWTSSTSNACGFSNSFIDSIVNNHFDTICAVRYHLGFPPPGNDSMYLQNPVQSDQRKNYYNISALPATLIDGTEHIFLPYYVDSNFTIPLDKRLKLGSPLALTVSDTRIGGDSIMSNINLNIIQNLKPGNYRLRVFAIERLVNYSTPPGSNGETQFYDVFRYSVTDSDGISINGNPGSYQYSFNYFKQPFWVDSMIYTIAFIQNDNTKEIINSGKARSLPLRNSFVKNRKNKLAMKPDKADNINYKHFNTFKFRNPADTVLSSFNSEIFESYFPPSGWNLINSDILFTFTQIDGINGVSIGGNSCVKIPFFEYGNIGQRDTLVTRTYYNVKAVDTLSFDYAYAQYLSTFADSLTVTLSTDGGSTYTIIFKKGGSALATSPETTLPFFPVTQSDWRTFAFPLSQVLPPDVNNNIPKSYELFQNFPNPFNPKTTIRYQIPSTAFVKLKIYDLLGREIQTLVNEQKQRGVYDVLFDGSNLSSGIYFCVLKVNDFIGVKKIALIK